MTDAKTYDPKKSDWWKAALAGEKVPIHADQAMRGFYAYKADKKKPPVPVALWYDAAGELLCHLDGKPYRNGLDLWLGCSRNPIPHDVYTSVVAGEGWPAEIRLTDDAGNVTGSSMDTSGIGHNSGDASADFTSLTGNIAEWLDRAKKVIKTGTPKTKEDADAVSDLATKLVELATEADKKRLEATKPLRDQVDDINASWNVFINDAKKVGKDLKTLAGIYIVEENKRRQEAAKAAQEAAEAEMAKNAPAAGLDGTDLAGPPPVRIEAEPVRTGTRKAVVMIDEKYVVIENRAEVFAYFAALENPPSDIMEAVERRTFALLKNGAPVPGAKIETRQRPR